MVREIKLTNGDIAFVDDEDFEKVSQYSWGSRKEGNTRYALYSINRGGFRTTLRMHRMVMDVPKGMEIDHIDGNGLNNQKSNLRIVSKRENAQNRINSKKERTSIFPGVSFESDKQRWRSQIKIDGIAKCLGNYDSECCAKAAYTGACKILEVIRARGVAQQAPAITLPKDMTTLECIDEGLKGLSDYFNAAVEGGESKAALRRMWDQQMGIVFALLKNYQQAPFACPYVCERVCIENVEEHDAALLAREREKWERERKASSTTVLSEDEVFFDVTPDPAGYRIYINFYNAGTFSIELSTEQLGRLQRQIYKLLPPDKYEKTSSAIEDITPEGAAIIQQAKKQAREDVLEDAAIAILKEAGIPETSVSHYTPKQDSDIPSIRVDKVVHILESLRSEVGKMNEQKPREKHLLYLDKSTPEEFINAELMDWIYLVGDISTPYELDFVRQFGHAFKTRDNQMRKEGAKAERERVLKIVDQIREAALGMLNPPTGSFSSQDRFRKECMDEIDLLIKSLRSPGQKRERDPE